MFMSAPSLIFKAAVQMFSSGEIYNDLYVSGLEFGWGYLLSVVVGVPFGIACGWYKKFAYIFDPFINAMNATPRVALLPLVIIWLGIGILSKVGIIFLGAVFPISDQCARRRKNHAIQPLDRRKELRCFRMADFQKRRAAFDSALYSYGLKTWGGPGSNRRHGWRALCCHGWHRLHDHGGGCHVSNR